MPPSVRPPAPPGSRRSRVSLVALLLLVPLLLASELHVWVDEHGVTHLSDDADRAPKGATSGDGVEALRGLWDDGSLGPPVATPAEARGGAEGRLLRTLRGAVEDLQRGDRARATAALEEVLRLEPNRPEAHFYLALLDGRRGRIASAETHLRAFLEHAGPDLDPWRESAERRLARLADERRLMEAPEAQALRLVDLAHPDFAIQADAALLRAGRTDFANTVSGYLDDARTSLLDLVGTVPSEPTGVVLYGKAAYVRTHGHRFTFRTVGFFDGRIHVVSAAHPAGELRKLLFHEYAHALFRERVGGDRPFWLNEGLAELAEQRALGRTGMPRGDRQRLVRAATDGGWIPLARLGPGFDGLTDREARLAYLEATAAAAWVVARTSAPERARLLGRLGEGASADTALRETLGVDVRGIDAALRQAFGGPGAPGLQATAAERRPARVAP